MPLSSTKRTKEKLKRWGDSDRAKLLHLIDTGKVDIESEPDNIKAIRRDHFPERTYKNFSKNFRDFVADYTLGEEFEGARLWQLSESYYSSFLLTHWSSFSLSLFSGQNNPAENDYDEEVVEVNADATDDDDEQEAIMPPTAASVKKSAAKNTKSSNTQTVAKTSPQPPASFSLFTCDSYEKTQYVVNNIKFIELEIFVNGCIPSHAYQATLDPDKKIFYWKRATLKSAFSPARLQQSMPPGTYNENHTRVAAHSETHQEVLA